jgi:hypothetical protein
MLCIQYTYILFYLQQCITQRARMPGPGGLRAGSSAKGRIMVHGPDELWIQNFSLIWKSTLGLMVNQKNLQYNMTLKFPDFSKLHLLQFDVKDPDKRSSHIDPNKYLIQNVFISVEVAWILQWLVFLCQLVQIISQLRHMLNNLKFKSII